MSDFNPRAKALAIQLSQDSIRLRKRLLEITKRAGRGHVGPALSIIEIVDVLYRQVMMNSGDFHSKRWSKRDRFLLSKGHGCLGLYVVLEDLGLLDELDLSNFCSYESNFGGHPESSTVPVIEFSTGSLGHGMPVAVGLAVAAKLKKESWRVFVVVGDGELNEGSNWEAASHAHKHKLDNLVVIVDYNNMQASGEVSDVLDMHPLKDKWEAFGFETIEVNGHDREELKQALNARRDSSSPLCIIAYTVKGKGIKKAENSSVWHHKAKISAEEIDSLTLDLTI
jgi:transketolase